MAFEIERKYLVRGEQWKAGIIRTEHIIQGYFNTGSPKWVQRVRICDDRHAWLTIKTPRRGIVRDEFEYAIPVEDARQLLLLFCGNQVLAKHRHFL
ncbi:MAG: CYTH domain-containing protein, partial [Lentisphaerae bacterium]